MSIKAISGFTVDDTTTIIGITGLSAVLGIDLAGEPPPGAPLFGPVDMEATGVEAGWSNTGGSPDWDEDVIFKNGAHSLALPSGASVQSPETDVASFTWKFWYYVSALPAASGAFFVTYSAGFADFGGINLYADGSLAVSGFAATVDALLPNTWHLITIKMAKGAGSTAFASVGFSTDGTSPTSGNKFASDSALTFPNNFVYNRLVTPTGITSYFDDVYAETP